MSQIEQLARNQYVSAYSQALVHLGLGDRDAELRWLQAAVEERSWYLPFAGVEPMLDELRGDPRFEAILRTIGAVQ